MEYFTPSSPINLYHDIKVFTYGKICYLIFKFRASLIVPCFLHKNICEKKYKLHNCDFPNFKKNQKSNDYNVLIPLIIMFLTIT